MSRTLRFTGQGWILAGMMIVALSSLNLIAQETPTEEELLIAEADRLIEKQLYQQAFDTLIFGLNQLNLALIQDEIDQVSQTKASLKLLDVLTQRMFENDTYGRYISLNDRAQYLEEAIGLAESLNLDSLVAAKNYILGVDNSILSNYEQSINLLEKVYTISTDKGYNELMLRTLYQLFKGYRNVGNVEASLEKLIAYEKRSQQIGIPYHIQTSNEALGNFYLNRKDYVRGITYYKEAIRLAEKHELDPYYSLTSLAICFDESDSVEQAEQTYQKAFELLKSTEHDQEYYYKIAGLTLNYGTFFNSKKKNYHAALQMFREGLEAAETLDYKYYIGYAREGMAEAYHEMKEDKQALQIRLENYDLIKEIGEVELMRQAEYGLSQSYERLGQYQEALLHFRHGKDLSDSLLNEARVQAISALETEFETEKKEQEIALLNEQTERQNARQSGLLVIGALLIIILLITFYALSNKQRANQLITSQKETLVKTNERLKELSEFKDNLTHMIVHDMKNPLNAVIGLSKGEASQKRMDTIAQSGQQMLNMVSNMLDVQKFEEAHVSLNTSPHSFYQLFKEAHVYLELLMHSKNIELKKDIDQRVFVEVDSELVVRILGNLLSNAIKFSNLGGSIEIEAKPDQTGQLLLVSITDHGPGLHPQELQQVFDKYWQGAKQAGYNSSTGLGLTFCKLAVEAHGGSIDVYSRPNEYTTFTFSLPIAHIADERAVLKEPDALEREESLILESDIAILSKYISELGGLKVHQVGKINDIIRQMDQEEVKSPWKTNLVSAMHQGNQQRFDELVEMLK